MTLNDWEKLSDKDRTELFGMDSPIAWRNRNSGDYLVIAKSKNHYVLYPADEEQSGHNIDSSRNEAALEIKAAALMTKTDEVFNRGYMSKLKV